MSVITLSIIMLSVVTLSIFIMRVILLSVVILSVIIQSVVLAGVMAPAQNGNNEGNDFVSMALPRVIIAWRHDFGSTNI